MFLKKDFERVELALVVCLTGPAYIWDICTVEFLVFFSNFYLAAALSSSTS